MLRLGFVANFISEPVLIGFKAGIGLVIVLDQVPKLLGIHFPKTGFFRNLRAIVQHLPETSWPTLAVGVATIGLLVALDHFLPKAPAPLVVVAAGIAAMSLFGLQPPGWRPSERSRGACRPSAPELPLVARLWPAALGIALMSFTETIAAAALSRDPTSRRSARTGSSWRRAWPTRAEVSSARCRRAGERPRRP